MSAQVICVCGEVVKARRKGQTLLADKCESCGYGPWNATPLPGAQSSDLRAVLDLALTVEDRTDEENHSLVRLSALLEPLALLDLKETHA